MRLNIRQLVSVAGLIATFGVAVADGDSYPWKSVSRFEIDNVEGIEYSYTAGVPIKLEVVGSASLSSVIPDPKSGFHVQASIDKEDLSRSVAGANGEWKDDLQGWVVELPGVEESRYRLQVSLYCADDASICAQTYGRAAQVTETFYIDVR